MAKRQALATARLREQHPLVAEVCSSLGVLLQIVKVGYLNEDYEGMYAPQTKTLYITEGTESLETTLYHEVVHVLQVEADLPIFSTPKAYKAWRMLYKQSLDEGDLDFAEYISSPLERGAWTCDLDSHMFVVPLLEFYLNIGRTPEMEEIKTLLGGSALSLEEMLDLDKV